MARESGSKLNRLQHLLPEGLLVTAAWLDARGYSSQLRSQYVAAGWLTQPVRGVYRRPGLPLKWDDVVASLQGLLEVPAFVGGRSALEVEGYGHYISPEGLREVHLYTQEQLPGWLFKLDVGARFVRHHAARLFPDLAVPKLHQVDFMRAESWTEQAQSVGYHISGLDELTLDSDAWPVLGSGPERAILELLDGIPHAETFEQADKFMEALHTLRPNLVQHLLEHCRSIKVKRVFLWLAERHDLPWLRKLDLEQVDLGRGKRVLVKGGRLDPKYQITVPSELAGVE
jgi:hypothetical protein